MQKAARSRPVWSKSVKRQVPSSVEPHDAREVAKAFLQGCNYNSTNGRAVTFDPRGSRTSPGWTT